MRRPRASRCASGQLPADPQGRGRQLADSVARSPTRTRSLRPDLAIKAARLAPDWGLATPGRAFDPRTWASFSSRSSARPERVPAASAAALRPPTEKRRPARAKRAGTGSRARPPASGSPHRGCGAVLGEQDPGLAQQPGGGQVAGMAIGIEDARRSSRPAVVRPAAVMRQRHRSRRSPVGPNPSSGRASPSPPQAVGARTRPSARAGACPPSSPDSAPAPPARRERTRRPAERDALAVAEGLEGAPLPVPATGALRWITPG